MTSLRPGRSRGPRRTSKRTAKAWAVQDAKARFSELLQASLTQGPQIVTLRGVEAAVLVPVEEWRRLQQAAQPTLKELLLAEGPRADISLPPRRRWRPRALPALR